MRLAQILATVMLLALLSRPALAEPRWLACKFTDTRWQDAELLSWCSTTFAAPPRCSMAAA